MKIFSLKWRAVNGTHKVCLSQPQVTRESASSFESASPMQCSWSKVVPGASQLLLQTEPVVREQLSMEMDGTMRNSIPQPERNDHLRANINTLWSHSPTKASLQCIPCGNWCRAIPRDERLRHPLLLIPGHSENWKNISPLNRSLAVKIDLPSTKERFSNYSSQASALCIIHGWLRPPIRVQEY